MVDNLVDDSTSGGDLSSIEKDLQADAAVRRAASEKAPKGRKQQAATELEDAQDAVLPAKLRGKTLAEVAELYQNLESAYGRMANDLGVQRKMTDVVLGLKRENDLGNNTAPTKVQIKSDELLENPTAALERFQAPRDAEQAQRLANVEAQLQANAFSMRHPDYQEIGQDPKFSEWVGASPTRLRAAQAARGGDWSAASDLLTEFKAQRTADADTLDNDEDGEDEEKPVRETPLAKARKAGLESSSQGTGGGVRKAGKVYRRADLMKLHIERPDVYYSEEMQAEIISAYAEGRVK